MTSIHMVLPSPKTPKCNRIDARKCAAEGLGTLLLLAVVVGSGIMAERLAGGNVAVALLGNTLSTGAALAVLIPMFGSISGAHFNPAVSLIQVLRRVISPREGLAYVVVQTLAAVLGVWLAHAMFDLPILQTSEKLRTGTGQWLSEAVATFGLVATILFTSRYKPDWVAQAVALYIISAYWFTASTSFANPAVTVARSLSDTFAGIAPAHVVWFIVAQIVGALLALVVYKWMSQDT